MHPSCESIIAEKGECMKNKVLKTVAVSIACVLGFLLLVLGGLNIAKFVIYSDYYAIESRLCDNPGLGDGFVCQGICAYEEADKIFVSGYMKDRSASRVYVTDTEDNSYFVSMTVDGKSFDGHAGGIAVHDNTVYLGDGGRLYTFSVELLLNAKDGDSVEIGKGTAINNEASFVFADDNYVYVGEFHDGTNYVTDHPFETENGTHYAIVSRYSHGDLSKPDRVYSVRDKVQGICFTEDGKIVLSTSYGLADSVYYVYNESEAVDSGLTQDGAPVYLLTKCIKEVKGPAMSEGLDVRNGKVITLTESASDKYIYGKFFFANDIVELDFQ